MKDDLFIAGMKITYCQAMPSDTALIIGENEVVVCKDFPQPNENNQIKVLNFPRSDVKEFPLDLKFFEKEQEDDRNKARMSLLFNWHYKTI